MLIVVMREMAVHHRATTAVPMMSVEESYPLKVAAQDGRSDRQVYVTNWHCYHLHPELQLAPGKIL